LIDFHLHPSYSIDSGAPVENIIEAALDKNLQAICFTTHIDLNPKRDCLDNYIRCGGKLRRCCEETVEAYIEDVRASAERYSGRIEVLIGFELSYGTYFENRARDFISENKPDFVLGAIHCIDNIGITARDEAPGYFRSVGVGEAARAFVDATGKLAESGIFATIAHIDGIKKYGRAFYGESLDRELERLFPPVFTRMAELGIGIELNTASLRKGHPDIYPSKRLLELAGEAGVTVNSVGSDAHKPEEVGFRLEEAYRLLDETGIAIGEPLARYI